MKKAIEEDVTVQALNWTLMDVIALVNIVVKQRAQTGQASSPGYPKRVPTNRSRSQKIQ